MTTPALFLKGRPDQAVRRGTRPTEGTRKGRPRIRCPQCAWEPERQDRWMCVCLCSWNTFDTHGVCPRCGLRWTNTQCLRCTRWSRHEDWYEEDDDGAPR